MIPRESPTDAPTRSSWLLPALIVLAALVAHGLCLGSTFYLDDWTQIVDNDSVDSGQWWGYRQRALTYLTYWLTFRGFGMSAPAFHAGNLLLHAGVALTVYGFAREFLAAAAGVPPDRARRIGAWAGALFAVHPLCSEIPNYTRARDIALVSLFTVLTAWAILRWRRRGGWRWLVAAMAAGLAATFSKEVGIVVAGGSAALVWFGVGSANKQTTLTEGKRPFWPWAIGAVVLLSGLGLALRSGPVYSYLWPVGHTVVRSLSDPRSGWHLLTQARVFWQYAWRVVLPVRLCSDHLIPWTRSMADGTAWLAAAALCAVLALTAALWFRRRTRPVALLLALTLLAILHRLGNITGELMVEYRMYPAMAFLCLALVWGLDDFLARRAFRRVHPAILLLLVTICAALSILRTRDWRTPETLAANITAQYPLQARARQEVQEADLRAGRWSSVVAAQDDIRHALDGQEAFNKSQTVRRYDYILEALTRVSSEGNYAQGLARTQDEWAAYDHLDRLSRAVQGNGLTETVYPAMIFYARGMIHAAFGPEEAAVADLRRSQEFMPVFDLQKRELRRIEARQKP